MSVARMVSIHTGGEGNNRRLSTALQHRAATFEPRLPDTPRVQSNATTTCPPKSPFQECPGSKKDLRAPPPGPICERLGLARRHQIQSPRQRGAFGRRTRRMRSRVAPDGPTDFTQIKIILTLINFNALASQFRETLLLRVISFAEYGAVEPLRDQRLVR